MLVVVLCGRDLVGFEEVFEGMGVVWVGEMGDGVVVEVVVVVGDGEEGEMGRLVEVGGKIVDEVLENSGIVVEFEE